VVGEWWTERWNEPGPDGKPAAQLFPFKPGEPLFAGDQTYRHTQHTVGRIEFGRQFPNVLRDRPAVTIPDDQDVMTKTDDQETTKMPGTLEFQCTLKFQCGPRFSVAGPAGQPLQFPGWPVVTDLPPE